MRKVFIILNIIVTIQYTHAQAGFNKPFDIGLASAFSSLEYNNGVVTIYGTIYDQGSPPYWDLLFHQVDTFGNTLNNRVFIDSIGDDFTGCYPNSFIKLSDGTGYAGVGTFFFRETGFLIIYNNDGSVNKFIEYPDAEPRASFFIEIFEFNGS